MVVLRQRDLVHDRLSRRVGARRHDRQADSGHRPRAGLRGDEAHGDQPPLRLSGRLCRAGVGAFRQGARVGVEDPRVRLRRLLHRPGGPCARPAGGLRLLPAPLALVPQPDRPRDALHARARQPGTLAHPLRAGRLPGARLGARLGRHHGGIHAAIYVVRTPRRGGPHRARGRAARSTSGASTRSS